MNGKPKILITGSLGFIFSNFIRKVAFDKLPYSIISVDKAVNSYLLNNIYINKSLTNHHMADITDEHIMNRIFEFERPDMVIHAAAQSSVDASIKEQSDLIKSNVLGTQVLLNASLKWDIKKFLYISTDEVYGSLNANDESWTENSAIAPRNPYSASKASAEMFVKSFGILHGMPYLITRSSNNYGPRQSPDKLIPRVIKCIINKEKIPIYGKGEQIRDWLHVFDNCSAILKVLENGKDGEIYNISSNQEYMNIEIVNMICNAMESGHDLISFIEDPRKAAHDFRYSIVADKVKELGWKPEFKFKDQIENVCNWYINNKWFLK